MEKTVFHIYKKLYRHLFKFCISESPEAKKAIEDMQDIVFNSRDKHIGHLYQIAKNAIHITAAGQSNFLQKSSEYQVSIAEKDYIDRWCLFSLLLLVYQYIYPDSEQIKKCESEISKAAAQLDQEQIWDYKFDFEDADYMIQMHNAQETTLYSAYDETYARRAFKLENRSFLTILKGYSSSTPFFYSALKERFHDVQIKGGGIYLKWHGTGIVIDPGINFMENMHMAGLNVRDIDIIIVTHNHIDHNGDLTTIDDIAGHLKKKNIVLYMDKMTKEDFEGRLENFAEENRKTVDFSKGLSEFCVGTKNDILIKAIPTKHIKDRENKYLEDTTYAVKITLQENKTVKAVIGFTSDTRYLKELSEEFKDCDYIIANFSETRQEDYLKKEAKETHLGYTGCYNLIKDCNTERSTEEKHAIVAGNPRYIISEFWAGKGDVRKEFVRRLRQETKYDYIYPGDIGMFFFLDQPTFLCGLCKCERGLEQLHIIRPGAEYSLISNVCNECIL